MSETVLVLDFGGQYKELISRIVRELNVYSLIKPCRITIDEIKQINPIGIILTGGLKSAYLHDSPKCDPKVFKLGIPMLGICYGMQIMCHILGGEVKPAKQGEYGTVSFSQNDDSTLFNHQRFYDLRIFRHLSQRFTARVVADNERNIFRQPRSI